MPNPLRVEQQYQTLKQALLLVGSPRMKLALMLDFFRDLESQHSSFLPAYAEELLPHWWDLLEQTDFAGTSPRWLGRFIGLTRELAQKYPQLHRNNRWQIVEQHLVAEQQRIDKWIESRDKGTPQPGELRPGQVWIPFVEREQMLSKLVPKFAALRRLNVEVGFSRTAKGRDELQLDQAAQSESDSSASLHQALDAARRLVSTHAAISPKRPVVVRARLLGSGIIIGESIGAGLAIAIFTELLRVFQHREEFIIPPYVAITGGVDANGKLRAVDEKGLALKVEACTYSWIRYLIVPAEQQEFAETAAAKLVSEGKTRVHIVGARTVEDFIVNRRVSTSRYVPFTVHAGRKVWKQRRPVAAMVIILLLAIVGKLWYGPIDKEPADLKFEGETMVVVNRHGDALTEIRVGPETVDQANATGGVAAIADIDGDGNKEVIWGQALRDNPKQVSRIVCQEIRSHTMCWEFPLVRRLEFPNTTDVSDSNFSFRSLLLGDFDNDKRDELLVLANHVNVFPSVILKIDPTNGREKDCYLHIGHLIHIRTADLDGDGILEVLATGVNNAYREACFTVLDPRFIHGHSPLRPSYAVEGYDPGAERTYVRIPMTFVGKAVEQATKNSADDVEIWGSTQTMIVHVRDHDYSAYGATLLYHFSFDLSPVSIGTGSDYDKVAQLFIDEGKTDLFPRGTRFEDVKKSYLDRQLRTLLYWDGSEWQNQPVPSRRWKEAVKALK
jgi:hypothetical protein